MAVDAPNESADSIDEDTIAQWRQLAAFQHGKAVQALQANVHNKPPVPPMNVCLAAIGTWDNGVKQFAAVGLKLAAHGHRVRLAANECFRPKIVALGLEFFPLVSAPDSVQAQLIHDAQLAALDSETDRSDHQALLVVACRLRLGLTAGKPVAVCGSHPSQLFTARQCQRAGVGISPIDPTLVWSFEQLLQLNIGANAHALARTFDPDRALSTAVGAFYSRLPREAMVCDVDARKLARVFDSQHTVKLSLEAYLAVQPVRDDSKGFMPYKPLQYDNFCPPVFSIGGNPSETPRDVKPSRGLDAVGMAVEVLNAQDERRSSELSHGSSESSAGSVNARVVDTEVFWTTKEEEEAVRKSTNAAYERLVKPPAPRKRDKVAQLFADNSTKLVSSPRQLH